jgi:hypothetical protein
MRAMITKKGKPAKNQFEVFDEHGKHFMSYGSQIATINGDEVTLYNPYWDMYSMTTNYYLLQFLEEDSIKEIRKKVNSGDYLVA